MSSTLTKADIVNSLLSKSKEKLPVVKDQVNSLIEIMKDVMRLEDELLISGFGKFEARSMRARRRRNPDPCQTIMIPARRVIVFRVSRKFRAELNL